MAEQQRHHLPHHARASSSSRRAHGWASDHPTVRIHGSDSNPILTPPPRAFDQIGLISKTKGSSTTASSSITQCSPTMPASGLAMVMRPRAGSFYSSSSSRGANFTAATTRPSSISSTTTTAACSTSAVVTRVATSSTTATTRSTVPPRSQARDLVVHISTAATVGAAATASASITVASTRRGTTATAVAKSKVELGASSSMRAREPKKRKEKEVLDASATRFDSTQMDTSIGSIPTCQSVSVSNSKHLD